MIKCVLLLCARYALLDKQTSALSAISILEDLTVPVLPGIIGSLSAVFVLRREQEDDSKLELTMTAGMMSLQRQSFPVSVDFRDKLMTRGIATMQGVPIPAPGLFRLDLATTASGQVLGSWEMNISTIISQPTVSTAAVDTIPHVDQFATDGH